MSKKIFEDIMRGEDSIGGKNIYETYRDKQQNGKCKSKNINDGIKYE